MAVWPRDDRTKKAPPTRNHGLVKEQNRNYPNLEPGLIGAATLVEDENKYFKWAYVNRPSKKAAGFFTTRSGLFFRDSNIMQIQPV